MKRFRFLSILLALVLCLALVACGSDDTTGTDNASTAGTASDVSDTGTPGTASDASDTGTAGTTGDAGDTNTPGTTNDESDTDTTTDTDDTQGESHPGDDPHESTGEYHTVTFDSQGGSDIPSQSVLDGDYARQPSRPEKAGAYFLHWSDAVGGERFLFTSRIITQDITLYAVWGEAYTVTFDTQGGSDIPAQYVSPDTSAREPDSPTKDGFHFLGWYTAAQGGTEWHWNDRVEGNITVYAHWESDAVTNATASLTFAYDRTLNGYVVTGVGQESDIHIPAVYNDGSHGEQAVVGIDDRAFYNKNITSVALPDTLLSIGTNAFSRTNLTSVTIPASVTTLGNYAFSDCSALAEVIFEEGSRLDTIGNRTFAYDPALTDLTIPASVTSIGSNLIRNSGVTILRFLGTRNAWEALDKANGWDTGKTDVTVICADDNA